MSNTTKPEDFVLESNIEFLFKHSKDIYEEHSDLIDRLNSIIDATQSPINPVFADIITLYNDKIEKIYSEIYEKYLIFHKHQPVRNIGKEVETFFNKRYNNNKEMEK